MDFWKIIGISLLLSSCQSAQYQPPDSQSYPKESVLQTPQNPLMEDYNRVKHRIATPYHPHDYAAKHSNHK